MNKQCWLNIQRLQKRLQKCNQVLFSHGSLPLLRLYRILLIIIDLKNYYYYYYHYYYYYFFIPLFQIDCRRRGVPDFGAYGGLGAEDRAEAGVEDAQSLKSSRLQAAAYSSQLEQDFSPNSEIFAEFIEFKNAEEEGSTDLEA